ncbi:Receptor protein kinase-like protein [Quillaja saponaria]|uniref:Receptor protein kinase-like protein n=1 Tax=Quillaja saponaria TaxID=32244 RepID=A0AAD7KU56_QUISA|nr:Receptor protein kinase-like protein [Quillaja saponaria]
MSFNTQNLHFWWRISSFVLLLLRSVALNSDGVLLLSFKYSILSDPLSVLESWNYKDKTPCSWMGVTCSEIGNPGTIDMFRVTSLVLPNSQLLGSIPTDLGMIQHLRHLDLSNNFFNGSLPTSILNSSELQVLSLSNNVISGELPESIGKLTNLQLLNLSDNALAGKVPENITVLKNLGIVSLRSNYFSGSIPGGFSFIEVLDLSSNLLNGSLPMDFGGDSLRYLNLSYNKVSNTIPPEFARGIPVNATIDLSFNNLTGPIPHSPALLNQKTELLAGNSDLCGKPLKILCSIPSSMSTSPNISTTSSPAIAVVPKTIDSNPATKTPGSFNRTRNESPGGLKPATIVGIAVGDLAGIAVLGMVILYVYQLRKKKQSLKATNDKEKKTETVTKQDPDSRTPTIPWSCLIIKGEETSEATSSDSDRDNVKIEISSGNHKEGTLVTVDGETELELETLLKASAYILGSSNASIVYKAVLADGTAFAVRRIGECGIEKKKEFENQVKAIARFRHPNLVKVRGFYWGEDEKLVIYDYVPNGSLASTRRASSSPCHLPLEIRFKIAKGVAKGLAYIHEKKHVHGKINPSNILFSTEMEAIICDFGLDRLLLSNQANSSDRKLVNQRCLQELHNGGSPYAPMGSSSGSPWPYHAPESLQNIKPNAKWDVYSFGIVLLELLTGRVFSDRELGEWTAAGSVEEEKNRVFRIADAAIRADIEGREDAMFACFKLGFSCASIFPQKRPSMKEAIQILEKIPSSPH